MSGHTTGLRLFLVVLTWTTVFCQDSDSNLGSLIDEVFGPSPNEGNSNNNNEEDTRTNEALTNGVGSSLGGKPDTDGGTGLGGDQCQCVPYYLCENNTIITDGTGLLDIRIKGEQCDNYLDVCCREPLEPHEAIKPKPHGRLGCGKRNIDGVGFRITGNVDNEAQFGEFPWMVAILKEDVLEDGSRLNIYQCGGSLIHEQVVLTAAHCIVGKDAAALKVRAGEWDTQTKNELYPHQDRQVAQIIIHEKYYSGALYNDIALLILRNPLEFADNVDITCLPLQGDVVLNNECFASGWGKDVFDDEEKLMGDGMGIPPGSDGDLGVRFLTSRHDLPNSQHQRNTQGLLQGFQQEQKPNFIQGLIQGFQQQQEQKPNFVQGLFQGFQQQQQKPNFVQGLIQGFQQQQQKPNFIQGAFQGIQQQEQKPNIIQGFIQGFQQQKNQQERGFLKNFQNQQQQHQQQQRNIAQDIVQGIQGIVQKKADFIKSKTEDFFKQFNKNNDNHNNNNKNNNKSPPVVEPEHSNTLATPTTPSAFIVPGKEGHYQVILKRVDLPMVPRDRCVAELRKTRLGAFFRLHDSFVCAGGIAGKDTCKGDGGSPLVCPIPGREFQYQQVGIVAWGIGCGNETPAVYVNVAKFRDWIDQHLKKLNFKFEYNY